MSDPVTILHGDVIEQLRTLPDESVQCCVTSPPYWNLRSYLAVHDPAKALEIGGEPTPEAYIARLVEVFREVRRVLRKDGTLWINLGDGFAAKNLLLIPARVAMALQADGWVLRQSCPWLKRNNMPDSVKDRPATTIETIFLLAKSPAYRYDAAAVKVVAVKGHAGSQFHTGKTATHQQGRSSTKPREDDGTRLRRSSDWFMESWQGLIQDEAGDPLAFVVNTAPFKGSHFAVFPPNLVRPCIQACSRAGDVVLDPFGGSGTTGQVALELGRRAVLIELNAEYLPLIRKRCGMEEVGAAA